MDRPMSHLEEGTNPVILLACLVIGLMIIVFILFIIFLDLAVLRRVVKLSETIRNQSLKEHDMIKEEEEKKKSRKGKTQEGPTSGDEITNLKLAVEQNTYRIRKRLEAINDVAKNERQRILRHKQAMQLLSLWCDRNEFFPGLRPNAVLLRYEPSRNLNDLLSNPLAIEYLKSHCDTECTIEHLFFLFDVAWLEELEAAEDSEEDPAMRKQIHHVAVTTAKTIIERYIAEDAPQQINISSATFQVLRDKGTSYKRGMFKEAVNEVKLMLDTDILPRFQSTTSYTAMSENLYIDSFASADAEMSTESESTAGSVLSDDTNVGGSNMVAFNFRNLYATFDGDTDLGSTCTNEMSVLDDTVTNSTITGQTTGTGGDAQSSGIRLGTVSSSNKNEFDDDDDDTSSSSSGASEPCDVKMDKPEKKEEKDESDTSSGSDLSVSSSSSSSSSD